MFCEKKKSGYQAIKVYNSICMKRKCQKQDDNIIDQHVNRGLI